MENETKQFRNKEKFFDMREREQSIEENPIRYGKEQYQKGLWAGKMEAYDRIETTIAEWRSGVAAEDATMQLVYEHMGKLISLLRKTES